MNVEIRRRIAALDTRLRQTDDLLHVVIGALIAGGKIEQVALEARIGNRDCHTEREQAGERGGEDGDGDYLWRHGTRSAASRVMR